MPKAYTKLLEWMRNPDGDGTGGGSGAAGSAGSTTGTSGGSGGAASTVVTGAGGGEAAGAGSGTNGTGGTGTAAAAGQTGQQAQGQQVATHPFGDNWRDTIYDALPEAEKTPKTKDWLARRGGLSDVIRSGIHADATISKLTAERVKVPTGQNDDPKDVEAFRKAVGVPEKADAYQVQPPKEYNNGQWTDFDKDLIPEIQKVAFDTNMNHRTGDDHQPCRF
jgi:hypothetical protein